MRGFVRFSRLLRLWLQEADHLGMLKEGLDLTEIADFIVIAMNGAAPLYAASRDPKIWQQSISQLQHYLRQLKN